MVHVKRLHSKNERKFQNLKIHPTPSNNIDHKIDQIRILVLVEVDVGGPKSDAQIYHIQNFHLQDDGLQNDESKF